MAGDGISTGGGATSPDPTYARELAAIASRLGAIAEQSAQSVDTVHDGSIAQHEPVTDLVLADAALGELAWRRKRQNILGEAAHLGEPTWELLLDLFVNQVRGCPVTVTSACVAAGVPTTTALRYMSALIEGGLLERKSNDHDRRTQFVKLTNRASRLIREALAIAP